MEDSGKEFEVLNFLYNTINDNFRAKCLQQTLEIWRHQETRVGPMDPATRKLSKVRKRLRRERSHEFFNQVHSSTESAGNMRLIHFGRKAISLMLFGLTGAFALSALDDYAIYRDCSSKAIEKATHNQSLKEALGEPIVRGWWYNASLAVAHQKRSVSCTFPIVGAQGSGIIQLKAIHHGENSLFTFLGSQEWEMLLLEALLHIPANEESKRTLRINLMEHSNLPGIKDCKECQLAKPLNSQNDLDMQMGNKNQGNFK